MNFSEVYEKIESSKIFDRFKLEHPGAELCAGFFILDFIENNNQTALDYKIGDKIFTFSIENNEITLKEDQLIQSGRPLRKILPEVKIEVNELKSIAGIRILDEGIKNKLQKIIAVLQMHEMEQVWNLTCMLDGLMIVNMQIES